MWSTCRSFKGHIRYCNGMTLFFMCVSNKLCQVTFACLSTATMRNECYSDSLSTSIPNFKLLLSNCWFQWEYGKCHLGRRFHSWKLDGNGFPICILVPSHETDCAVFWPQNSNMETVHDWVFGVHKCKICKDLRWKLFQHWQSEWQIDALHDYQRDRYLLNGLDDGCKDYCKVQHIIMNFAHFPKHGSCTPFNSCNIAASQERRMRNNPSQEMFEDVFVVGHDGHVELFLLHLFVLRLLLRPKIQWWAALPW